MRTVKNYLSGLFCLILFSCEKDPLAQIGKANINPIITKDPTNILPNSALVGLSVQDEGGEALAASGLIYAKGKTMPTEIDQVILFNSPVLTSTNFTLKDLIPGNTYYFKSFATTRTGKTYYGNIKSIPTPNYSSAYTNGMVAYYPLNNEGVDYSNSNNTLGYPISLQSNSSRNGSPKSAFNFNGVNTAMFRSSPNSFPNRRNAYSLIFWFKPNNLSEATIIGFGTGGGPSNKSTYFKINNKGQGSIYHWDNDWDSSFGFNTNYWYFACITYDGNFETIHLREYQTSRSYYVTEKYLPTIDIESSLISIGARVTNPSGNAAQFFNGSIDDVRIFNRKLNQSEIDYWYNN
jgi:hypothetical protein